MSDNGEDYDAESYISECEDEGSSNFSEDDSIGTEDFDWAKQFPQSPIRHPNSEGPIDRQKLLSDWKAHRKALRDELRGLRDSHHSRLYSDQDIDKQLPASGTGNYTGMNPDDNSFGQFGFVASIPVAGDPDWRHMPIKQLLDEGHEFFLGSSDARSHVWTHLPVNDLESVYKVMTQIYFKQGIPKNSAERKSYRTLRRGILAGRWAVEQSTPFHQLGLQSSCRTIKVSEEGEKAEYTVSLFMPYLHWESSIAREHTGSIIQSASKASQGDIDSLPCGMQEKMLRYHIPYNPLFHNRRTLDQFSYPMLNSLKSRDRDQVVERYARKQGWPERNVLMVDQLWLWIVKPGIVLTCFPGTWSDEASCTDTPREDLFPSIFRYIDDAHKRRWIKTPEKLACCIVDRCASNVFDPDLYINDKLNFLGMFRRSIAINMDSQNALYGSIVRAANGSRISATTVSDADQEFNILIEIKDILDELSILRSIQREQEAVLRHYEAVGHLDYSLTDYYRHQRPKEREDVVVDLIKKATSVHKHLLHFIDMRQKQTNLAQLRSSEDVLASMRDILESSKKVQDSSKEILESTKQMMKQSKESGDTLMIFTVVTIIFLPISTLASMFSLNAQELNDGKLSIGVVFAYIGPLAVLLITVILLVGYNEATKRGFRKLLPGFLLSKRQTQRAGD